MGKKLRKPKNTNLHAKFRAPMTFGVGIRQGRHVARGEPGWQLPSKNFTLPSK